jgi:hypothetical protein
VLLLYAAMFEPRGLLTQTHVISLVGGGASHYEKKTLLNLSEKVTEYLYLSTVISKFTGRCFLENGCVNEKQISCNK